MLVLVEKVEVVVKAVEVGDAWRWCRRWWWWVMVAVVVAAATASAATEGSFWVVEGADRHPQSRAFTPCRDDNRASFVSERATLRRARSVSRRELSSSWPVPA